MLVLSRELTKMPTHLPAISAVALDHLHLGQRLAAHSDGARSAVAAAVVDLHAFAYALCVVIALVIVLSERRSGEWGWLVDRWDGSAVEVAGCWLVRDGGASIGGGNGRVGLETPDVDVFEEA